jgi:hypothetical protein
MEMDGGIRDIKSLWGPWWAMNSKMYLYITSRGAGRCPPGLSLLAMTPTTTLGLMWLPLCSSGISSRLTSAGMGPWPESLQCGAEGQEPRSGDVNRPNTRIDNRSAFAALDFDFDFYRGHPPDTDLWLLHRRELILTTTVHTNEV